MCVIMFEMHARETFRIDSGAVFGSVSLEVLAKHGHRLPLLIYECTLTLNQRLVIGTRGTRCQTVSFNTSQAKIRTSFIDTGEQSTIGATTFVQGNVERGVLR
jgi:hypothetical protein